MFSYKQVVLLINPLGLNMDLHITDPIKKKYIQAHEKKKWQKKRKDMREINTESGAVFSQRSCILHVKHS